MASDVNTESEAKAAPVTEQETGEKLAHQATTPGSGKQIQQQIKRVNNQILFVVLFRAHLLWRELELFYYHCSGNSFIACRG